MKADSIKRLVLMLLVLVAVYIWWGNVNLLAPSSTVTDQTASRASGRELIEYQRLGYQPPRVNPFRLQVEDNPADYEEALPAPVPVAPVPASQSWRLLGFVSSRKHTLAVLRDAAGTSRLCQAGDSIGQWELARVNGDHAIVQQDVWTDTLWLPAAKR